MNNEKKKILYIIHSFGTGGMEKVVLDLANKLDKNRYQVSILVLSNEELESFKFLDSGINRIALGFQKNGVRSLRFWLTGLRNVKDILNDLKPDIVHTHTFFSHLFFLSIAFKLAKVNFLHFRTIHSAGFYYENQRKFSNKIKLLSEKIAMQLSNTYLISVSKTAHENNNSYFKKIARGIQLIYNGVDLEKYNKQLYSHISKKDFHLNQSSIAISYVARLENGKNHDFLIDLWPAVISKIPEAILCLIGDGSLKETLRKKVTENNLQDSIIFLGSQNNIAEILSITDICVFPSSFEGFSLVMLEKFSMGLPVVASDIKPFHEIATNNVNAFLVSIKEKEVFTEKIINLCLSKTLRNEIGKNARLTVQDFSIDNAIKSHEDYYENFLKR